MMRISLPRLPSVIWIVVLVSAALGLYQVKYKVKALQEKNTELAQELEDKREHLRVLEAEWSYLNRPERLQALAARHLRMQPMRGGQLTELAEIPYRGTGENAPMLASFPVRASGVMTATPAAGE